MTQHGSAPSPRVRLRSFTPVDVLFTTSPPNLSREEFRTGGKSDLTAPLTKCDGELRLVVGEIMRSSVTLWEEEGKRGVTNGALCSSLRRESFWRKSILRFFRALLSTQRVKFFSGLGLSGREVSPCSAVTLARGFDGPIIPWYLVRSAPCVVLLQSCM